MTRSFKLSTDAMFSLAEGGEAEFVVLISYDFTPAEAATREEPGHGDSVEITAISISAPNLLPVPVPDWFEAILTADGSFEAMLLADAFERIEVEREDAAERRYADREVAF
ncbi:hypothetical protein ASG43_03160 [Aureimonas sp. Leaf454]|uniref:hypothetical protein n=1 Tax=Aureimonas sp. Leaf454 TaxID=1736381 RepID=UPI0006FFF019|nr:hypothetical protein [Aureimonas sp. Leaf454]KQT54598.1 hypothetical protein ASG43_03160 [Aureimonas sp. Leaf454]